MAKTGRLTGPTKAEGDQVPVLEQRAARLELSNASLDVGRDLTVGGEVITPLGSLAVAVHGTAANLLSSNPTLPAGAFGMEDDTGLVKAGPGSWNSLVYINAGTLTAADPTEIDLQTVDTATTIGLKSTVGRRPIAYQANQYYFNVYGTSSDQTMVQSQLCLYPVYMDAGTIDRIGCHVATLAAGGTIRMGIYADNSGLPLNLIAEADNGIGTYPLDASSAGTKEAAITAAIAKPGWAWLGICAQGSGAIGIRGGSLNSFVPVPLGTGTPADDNTFRPCRIQSSVTGALPASLTLGGTNSQRARIFYRYSTVS